MTTPYASPASLTDTSESQTNSYGFLWVWLAFALTTATAWLHFLPFDTVNFVIVLLFGLPAFLGGVVCDSRFSGLSRCVLVATCLSFVFTSLVLVWIPQGFSLTLLAMICGAVHASLGVLASRNLAQARARFFVTISITYFVGIYLGPIGCAVLTTIPLLILQLLHRSPAA